ncbi:MAG: TIR domain-containing protein [Thermodesulfobacteriota bacterium]
MGPSVFISYRREDTSGFARLIYERFGKVFGQDHVFMDVVDLKPGDDYVQEIDDAVEKCQVLLVLIGRGWLSASDEHGRRLDNPHDWVRLEIVAALQRGIRVIPVLLEDAPMPKESELPKDLLGLARRNGFAMRHTRFDDDVSHLLKFVVDQFPKEAVSVEKSASGQEPQSHGTFDGSRKFRRVAFFAAVAALVVAGLIVVFVKAPTEPIGPAPGLQSRSDMSVLAPHKPEKPNALPRSGSEVAEPVQPLVSSPAKKSDDCNTAERYAQYAVEKLHRSEERIYALEKAVQLCPNNPALRIGLAQVHLRAAEGLLLLIETGREKGGDFQEAVDTYNKVVEKTTRQFEEALRLDDNNYDALTGLGNVYAVHQGRYELALECFKRAVAIRPGGGAELEGIKQAQQASDATSSRLLTKDELLQKRSQSTPPTMGLPGIDDVARWLIASRKRLGTLVFDPWSMEINRPHQIDQLNEIGKMLSSPDFLSYGAIIEVHSGIPGGYQRNVGLSKDRANAIKDYLVRHYDISPDRISVQGLGSSRPLVRSDDPQAARRNERVEVIFVPTRAESRPQVRVEPAAEKAAKSSQTASLAGGKLFALTIGISRYMDVSIPALRFAAKDATDFGEFLKSQTELFGQVRVTTLIDASATLSRINGSIFKLLEQSGRGDTVIFYFSGHGAYDPREPGSTYFLTYDTSAANPYGTALNLGRLDFLKRLGGQKVIVFADTPFVKGSSPPERAADLKQTMSKLISRNERDDSVAIIASSRSDEASYEKPGYDGSVFAQNLLRALRGEARRDQAGVVTLGSVYDFVAEQTGNASAGTQRPIFVGQGLRNLPLARPQ